MSTLSDQNETDPGETAQVARAMLSFTGTFERWARHQVASDAPSYARMRLLYELHCDGPQRMADLAGALEVTPRSITALVDRLEADGLVRRGAHPTDRRATIITLTDDALAAVERSMEHQAAIAELFGSLSADDRAALVRITSDLEARMRAVTEVSPRSDGGSRR
jgi:DNA-binding MarR family transcriptional regulator